MALHEVAPEPQNPLPEDERLTANERTQLLTPEDPQVTPYNLLSVRITRSVVTVFFAVSVVAFLLLTLNLFVHVPGLYTRGGGFLSWFFSLLAVSTTVNSALFFSTPSATERQIQYVTILLLFIDLIILVATPQLRYGEVAAGLLIPVWAILTSSLSAVSDLIVQWGKSSEERRLTGRVETRRTLSEWLKVSLNLFFNLLNLGLLILTTLSITLFAIDASRVPAPGERVSVDHAAYKVHINCFDLPGNHLYLLQENLQQTHPYVSRPDKPDPSKKNVTILAEAGSTSSEVYWSWITDLYAMNEIPRVCTWDRPGVAFSDSARGLTSAGDVSDILSEALTSFFSSEAEGSQKELPNLLLVSHGIGGLYSRVFASKHIASVKGMILIDTLHEDLIADYLTLWRGFKLFFKGAISPLGLQSIWSLFKRHGSFDRIAGKDMVHNSKFLNYQLKENAVAWVSRSEVRASNAVLVNLDIPVEVVSSSQMIKKSKKWSAKQRELTRLTKENVGWKILEGGHDLWEEGKTRKELQQILKDFVEYYI